MGRKEGSVHQKTSGGTHYTSGPRKDGSGGRFISTGTAKNHTTGLYSNSGTFEGTKKRGDGGPNKNWKP